jgi:glutathione S-transferase
MKLYCDPISTTSRPILMFAAEHGLMLEIEQVSLFLGQHRRTDFVALNPNRCVPVLVDGDFVLTESSAILKYLADRIGSETYPRELHERARVNAAMDWFATNFHNAAGHEFAYPTLFPTLSPLSEAALAELVAAGDAATHRWLAVLDIHMIGRDRDFVAGDSLTIADYLGASVVTLAEAAGIELEPYRNVRRWLSTMHGLPSWDMTYAAFNGLMSALRPRERAIAA